MSSTRNKNCVGDYNLEKNQYIQRNLYIQNPIYGIPQQPLVAGLGLIQGRMPSNELAHNPNDIESYLFGIGSTNLESPKADVQASYKNPKALNLYKPRQIIMPYDLSVEPNQRPFP